ncbi:MAG TPA: hypothetical protein VLF94_07000 [Chlamydiales bacterium]|nr:hypothetical protein [Chlamydiales bacterium]
MVTAALRVSPVPNCFVCMPVKWCCDKIRKLAEMIFGYLLRITTFQLGVINERGTYPIMRIFQRISSDPREERPYDPKRLEISRRLLIELGGVEGFVPAADGHANVHHMHFRSADIFNRFALLGAQRIDVMYHGKRRKALLNPPHILSKFRVPMVPYRMANGQRVQVALLPQAPTPNERPRVILRCHSPGRAMCMNRSEILRDLLAGHDVMIWDPRGTAKSTGTPSEGGYYLDVETIYQRLIALGYQSHEIYVFGFCKGAACATHLIRKYHADGINGILSNPYTSMKDVVEGYGWLGRLGARYGLKAIQSTDPEITRRVRQDGFDNVAKLRNLPHRVGPGGKLIIIHTNTDKMMPYGTADKLFDAFDDAGPIVPILRTHPNPRINGHMEPPDQDTRVQRRLYREIV